jgi:phage I-like protein
MNKRAPSSKTQAPGTVPGGFLLSINASGGAPEWIELIPAGPVIEGLDGRRWTMTDPEKVVASTKAKLPLVIDYQHASEREWINDPVPAAGWISELDVREGAVWGKADWTPRGAQMVADREYRFISPAFFHAADGAAEIIQLCSVGLVHKPNLKLTALNQRQTFQEPEPMDKALLAALGLADTATAQDAIAAVNQLKDDKTVALNAAETPPADKYVPMAQHQETVKALNERTAEIEQIRKARKEAAADALVDDAVKAGKVAPGAREHFRGLALNSFDATKAAIDALPVVIAAGEKDETRKEPSQGAGELTADEKAICARMGLDEADFVATKKSLA